MKKVISILLSVIIVASSVFGASFAYANGTATDKLEEIQNMPGFVPGENSIIQRNCYGFVSEVCKKLYGVPYAEGLYNNYQVKHNIARNCIGNKEIDNIFNKFRIGNCFF